VAEEDQQERLTALYASAAQGDEEALRQAFFDPDQTIQATALELLAQRNRQGATTLLVDATKSEQPETRFQALRLLHQTGQADAETVRSSLNEALADEDMTVRGYAIQALAEQRDPEAIESLRQAFSDPDPSVRLMVLENAMLKEGGRLLLQEALADEAEAIRSLAAFWLEQASAERR
jgi:HEAT repeat protein